MTVYIKSVLRLVTISGSWSVLVTYLILRAGEVEFILQACQPHCGDVVPVKIVHDIHDDDHRHQPEINLSPHLGLSFHPLLLRHGGYERGHLQLPLGGGMSRLGAGEAIVRDLVSRDLAIECCHAAGA